MELDRPFRVITPTVDGDVLAALARVESSFTPPQLHRVIGRHSEAGVRRALHRLTAQGLVHRRSAGRADLFELNRDHLAAPHVTAIATLFDEFLRRAQAHLAAWNPRCEYAALFGSAARGEMQPDSDLDILIVRPAHVDAEDPAWLEQLLHLEMAFTTWTGNDARALEWGAAEVRLGIQSGEPVLRDVLREGIRLFGPSNYLRAPAARP
jgi:predicted nucleotidyltransferase